MYLRGSRSVFHREKLEQSVRKFIESLKYYNPKTFCLLSYIVNLFALYLKNP